MPIPFLSSEEYDERGHQLYNEGQYDDAIEVLREGLSLYPNSVELYIGIGYARLMREEYAWARRSFEKALVLDPEHEDALAGLGETLLHFGDEKQAMMLFRRVLELGYQDDVDLILQVGRTLFRHDLIEAAREFFEAGHREAPELAETWACMGYVEHRLGSLQLAESHLRRALELDDGHSEARIYLANILYDRGDQKEAMIELQRTDPGEHWNEEGIWRYIELKKSRDHVSDGHPDLKAWEDRLAELVTEPDAIDEMLGDIEMRAAEAAAAQEEARGQLELFGALLNDLSEKKRHDSEVHSIAIDAREYVGSWDEIVRQMRDASRVFAGRSLQDYMATEARRGESLTGVRIPVHDAESFIRAAARAGLLRIVR
ncbi:MAG: tetratricopeptide repeat protein [Gemmatimonadaceae bacterium]